MLIQVARNKFKQVKATAANRGLFKLQMRGTWRKGRTPFPMSKCEQRAAERKQQLENDWSFLDD